MSDSSNDPKQVVSLDELKSMEISIEVQPHITMAHIFVGGSPRAQLSVKCGVASYGLTARVFKQLLPFATIKKQN